MKIYLVVISIRTQKKIADIDEPHKRLPSLEGSVARIARGRERRDDSPANVFGGNEKKNSNDEDFLYIFEIVGDLSWGHIGHVIRYTFEWTGTYRVPWNS